MIVPNSAIINKLQLTDIPSATELMGVFGFRAPQEHPDNTDPYHFSDPCNPQGRERQLDSAYSAARESAKSAYEAAIAAKAAQQHEEPKNE